ncbi:hypothetical protein D9M70_484550 [compost metagenome]
MGQAVHQVQLRADHVAGEVDDNVGALGHPKTNLGLVQQWCWQQVAVVADVGELLLHVARRHQVKLIEAAGTAIEQAESVPSCSDPQDRLDVAVDTDLVAQHPFGADLVPEQNPVRIEALVVEHQRVVVGVAGQAQRTGTRVMLIARVDVIEEQEEPRQAAIHVRRREVEGVVVVEQRAQRLTRVADTVLELVEAGVDIAIVVILELAR